MNRWFPLAILPLALSAGATCVTEPAEMGDIGPSAVLVCHDLERRFPGSALMVGALSIHSPTEVSVSVSVDGRPILMRYTLAGFSWNPCDLGFRIADAAVARSARSMTH